MRVGILGAGAIGTFVGGKLALALEPGAEPIVFVGRHQSAATTSGITIIDLDGTPRRLPESAFTYASEAKALGACEAVFVTVKSQATEEAGRELVKVLRPGACVVSLQNGLANPDTLRRVMPKCDVRGGMIPYNVVWEDNMVFRRSTSGAIALEQTSPTKRLAAQLVEAGLECEVRENIRGVLGTKLLFNLNNAINALSGVPLLEEISNRDFRHVYAASMREGTRVLLADGVKLERSGGLIPQIAPHVLDLPNAFFRRVASALIRVNPEAKSSMLGDLERGKKTEIDYLCGDIVTRGAAHSLPTPVNDLLTRLIRDAEDLGRSPKIAGKDLWAQVSTALLGAMSSATNS